MKLDLNNGIYALIEKGSTYGFKLSVFTPVEIKNAKNTHSKKEYFYPNFEQLSKKLLWIGIDTDCSKDLWQVNKSIEDFYFKLSKQMTELWELS